VFRKTYAVNDLAKVLVDRETLMARHAECPQCRSFVRDLTRLDTHSLTVELVAGYCSVCCTTTYFSPDADMRRARR
jgi:hypothetical protein